MVAAVTWGSLPKMRQGAFQLLCCWCRAGAPFLFTQVCSRPWLLCPHLPESGPPVLTASVAHSILRSGITTLSRCLWATILIAMGQGWCPPKGTLGSTSCSVLSPPGSREGLCLTTPSFM